MGISLHHFYVIPDDFLCFSDSGVCAHFAEQKNNQTTGQKTPFPEIPAIPTCR
jgi:hypothetical protein